jgi:hypothetical protein
LQLSRRSARFVRKYRSRKRISIQQTENWKSESGIRNPKSAFVRTEGDVGRTLKFRLDPGVHPPFPHIANKLNDIVGRSTNMNAAFRLVVASILLLSGVVSRAAGAQVPGASGREDALPLDGPEAQLDPIPPPALPPADSDRRPLESRAKAHEAVEPASSRGRGARLHVPKEPPATIAERPSASSNEQNAQWIPGYWDWDQAANDYIWVGGTWQTPPARSIWVAGRWMRDSEGWYRVPGVWSRRLDSGTRPASVTPRDRAAWGRNGPPADHPNDAPSVAPGPDYFYLAGHYAPDGDNVTWKPGFWSRVQPGWDWVPARWVRRPDGWDFRPGTWVRETGALAQNDDPIQRSTAQPLADDPTASSVDPKGRPSIPELNQGGSPPIAGGVIEGGPIPRTEIPGVGPLAPPQTVLPPGAPVVGESPLIYRGTVTGMRYYVVRPPGYFPYGPAGVVVPGVVPRFVRKILDRVLP